MANLLQMAPVPDYMAMRKEQRDVNDKSRMQGILSQMEDPREAADALMRGGFTDEAAQMGGMAQGRAAGGRADEQLELNKEQGGRAQQELEMKQLKDAMDREMAGFKQVVRYADMAINAYENEDDKVKGAEQLDRVLESVFGGEAWEQTPLPQKMKAMNLEEIKQATTPEETVELLRQVRDYAQSHIDMGEKLNPTAAIQEYEYGQEHPEFAEAQKEPPKAQTDLGKLTQDYQNDLITKEQYEKKSKDIVDDVSEDDFKDEKDLRKEYNNLSKAYFDVQGAYDRVLASVKDPSAAGDLSLIFNYMKMLDPGSTVREGEFATAQNSAGWSTRIRAQYNRAINGQRLGATQRDDFADRADRLWEAAKKTHKTTKDRYRKLARGYGLNPENVVSEEAQDTLGDESPPVEGAKKAPDGKWYVEKNGKFFMVTP